jgi:hypothetical protein
MTTVKFIRSHTATYLNAFQLVEDAHIDQNMWYALMNVTKLLCLMVIYKLLLNLRVEQVHSVLL